MAEFSHFDPRGASRMVNVGSKPESERMAVASAVVHMEEETLTMIREHRSSKKGDVLEVARLAGIMAAKKTSEIIPLCHPLQITSIEIDFTFPTKNELTIWATTRVFSRTGVEMESLTAVTGAALTVYDMCKFIDRGITIERVRLEAKSGGVSGDFSRAEPEER